MLGAAVVLLVGCQDPNLQAVLRDQAARTVTVATVAPAVCSVMDMASPGGGSGVIIDPAGFVLTNFHVVGEPDDVRKPGPQRPTPAPGQKPAEAKPPESVLPTAPEPPAEALERWNREHQDADDAARKQFIAEWQATWREEHLPKGKHHYKNKKVGLPDGQLYEAVVLGVDPGSDLAVLRLLPKHDGQTWPACRLGDSDQLLVGETVFAMGNPFLLATDFTPTVTFGIVSGTHRYQEGPGQRLLVYPDCIQVDAPVNPGNSGGPLFNEAGEVVGINGRISIGDRGRVNVGVGFAIASNQIKNFLADLLAGRHAEHGTLDMSAWYMRAPREETNRRGVFVQQTFKDSIVAAAGVSLGDELLHFNGELVRSANQLATMVGILPAGAWVSLGFRAAQAQGGYGSEQTVFVRLTALDTGSSADARADTERLASRENRRIATQSLLRTLGRGETAADGAVLTLTSPEQQTIRMLRRQELLRLEIGGAVLVRTGKGEGFRLEDGKPKQLTPEELARLERELAANPFLWRGPDRAIRLQGALLAGGVFVQAGPAFRFAIAADGDPEQWYFNDGRPAGYSFRDPLRKARLELHVCPPGVQPVGDALRVIVDGKLEHGWTVSGPVFETPPAELFRRPQ